MKSLSILCTAIFCLILCVLVYSKESRPSWMIPNKQEKEICKLNAKERQIKDMKKDHSLSCHVVCYYDDRSKEMYNSPDGQLCCDLVGVGPTGTCKDGKCPVGEID